ncbi:hypothetical protein PY257_00950 [Ramlibacter sp. H39-3-26]|uniref:exosortase H-associated membrane protein n=1 Tax=Curvibacter soli TaxID=3031331 RepID=UPI0023DBB55D|nr:exosortase H-associated membrane protein [Ramlibacter sp. H39-3-26]MDF1483771.1 hypothetical protein [Ramlibacter sp. H39-3-26]
MPQQPEPQRRAPRFSPLTRFFARAVAAFLAATALWWPVSDYASRPAAFVARVVLETAFDGWVRRTSSSPHKLEVETRLTVRMPQQPGMPRNMVAELTGEVDPAKYGYSLPLLLALLVAGSRRHLLRNALVGAACLVPFHAFSIAATLLKDMVLGGGPGVLAQTGFAQWQIELLAFCYQLGVLLMPTLAPILVWLGLDCSFASTLLRQEEPHPPSTPTQPEPPTAAPAPQMQEPQGLVSTSPAAVPPRRPPPPAAPR